MSPETTGSTVHLVLLRPYLEQLSTQRVLTIPVRASLMSRGVHLDVPLRKPLWVPLSTPQATFRGEGLTGSLRLNSPNHKPSLREEANEPS